MPLFDESDTEIEEDKSIYDVCADLLTSNLTQINFDDYSQEEIELIISLLIDNNLLPNISFIGEFPKYLDQLISNEYIIALYKDNKDIINMLDFFKDAYGIIVDKPFDYKFLTKKKYVELQGYTKDSIVLETSKVTINNFTQNIENDSVLAVINNDVEGLEHRIDYGLNPNKIIMGQYLFEVAIKNKQYSVMDYFLNNAKFDSLQVIHGKINYLELSIQENDSIAFEKLINNRDFYEYEFGKFTDFYHNTVAQKYPSFFIKLFKDDNDVLLKEFISFIVYNERTYTTIFTKKHFKDYFKLAKDNNSKKCKNLIKELRKEYKNKENEFIDIIKTKNVKKLQEIDLEFIDVNCIIEEKSAIEHAIDSGDIEIIGKILEIEALYLMPNKDGIYPLYKALLTNNHDIIMKFISSDMIDFYFINQRETSRNYLEQLDASLYAIKNDDAELLKKLLMFQYGEHNYINISPLLLDDIKSASPDSKKPNIDRLIEDIKSKQNNVNERLIGYAGNGAYDDLCAAIEHQSSNVNIIINKNTALNLAILNNHIRIVEKLIHSHVNVNLIDGHGKSPIECAIETNNREIVRMLLDRHNFRHFDFTHEKVTDYNPKHNPTKISIDNDNPEILDLILRRLHMAYNLELTKPYIDTLYNYASKNNKPNCIASIRRYLTMYMSSGRIFLTSNNLTIGDRLNYDQSISKPDKSVILSLKQLIERYGFKTEIVNDGFKYVKLTSKEYDLNKIFNEYEDIINNLKSCNYDYLTYKNDGGHYSLPKKKILSKMSLDEYKRTALTLFKKIKEGKDGHIGNYRTWTSKWFTVTKDKNSNDIYSFTVSGGISVKDCWAIMLIAARDKNAIKNKTLTESDIKSREEILVRAFIDCQRAYNKNNDQGIDDGRHAEPSCVHGTFNRPVLALSGGMHQDVNIITHPEEWAHDIARDVLGKFYLKYDKQAKLKKLLTLNPSQLEDRDNDFIVNFYKEASPFVKDSIIEKVGLESTGGLLSDKDLDTILISLPSIELPKDLKTHTETLKKYNDFEKMQNKPITKKDGPNLIQVKLPNTPDSFYLAILLSAEDQKIKRKDIVSIKDLRSIVAKVIELSTNQSKLDEPLPFLNKLDQNINKICKITIKRKVYDLLMSDNGEEYKSTTNDMLAPFVYKNKLESYIDGIKNCAKADLITKQIVSAIYNANIRVYKDEGQHEIDISSQHIFVPVTSKDRVLSVFKGRRYNEDQHINLVINSRHFKRVLRKIQQTGYRTISQQLDFDIKHYSDYEVMSGRDVAGFEQVKIPPDNNCCFNAALVAAKHAKLPKGESIINHHALRTMVSAKMETLYKNALKTTKLALRLGEPNLHETYKDAKDTIEVTFANAINEFNEFNKTSITTPEQYINAIKVIDVWGGAFELRMISEILNTSIEIYSSTYDTVINIERDTPNKISLRHTGTHYNVLVPPGSWMPLTKDSSILKFDSELDRFREIYKRDIRNNMWSNLHKAVYEAKPDRVKFLLSIGAKDCKDSDGKYAVDILPNQDLFVNSNDNTEEISTSAKKRKKRKNKTQINERPLKRQKVDVYKSIASATEDLTSEIIENNETIIESHKLCVDLIKANSLKIKIQTANDEAKSPINIKLKNLKRKWNSDGEEVFIDDEISPLKTQKTLTGKKVAKDDNDKLLLFSKNIESDEIKKQTSDIMDIDRQSTKVNKNDF